MEEIIPCPPCLETARGEQVVLAGNCSLGRSSDNTIKIASEKASRRHATIHAQDAGDYWLIDLGSINGTLLNGRRISLPTRLNDGDQICIAGQEFIFRAGSGEVFGEESICAATVVTAPEIRNEACWLLLADVEQFTQLSHRLDPEALAMMMGRWIRSCKTLVEEHGGTVNKYLGDGYLAFWRGKAELASRIAAAAGGFQKLQAEEEPAFRVVIHHGQITIGGAATLGEECLMGPEVNFIFRMEKVAGSQGVHLCVSSQARPMLAAHLNMTAVPGDHELKGFSGKHQFFQVL
jgi:adenylate cyclase